MANCTLVTGRAQKDKWAQAISRIVSAQLGFDPEAPPRLKASLARYNVASRDGLARFVVANPVDRAALKLLIHDGFSVKVVDAAGHSAVVTLRLVQPKPVVVRLQHFAAPAPMQLILQRLFAEITTSVAVRPELDANGRTVFDVRLKAGMRLPAYVELPDLAIAQELCDTQDLAVVKAMVGFVPNARGKHNLVFDSFVPWADRQTAQLRYEVQAEVHAGMLRPFADECGGVSKRSRATAPPGGDASMST